MRNQTISFKGNDAVMEQIATVARIDEIGVSAVIRKCIRQYIVKPEVQQKINQEPVSFLVS